MDVLYETGKRLPSGSYISQAKREKFRQPEGNGGLTSNGPSEKREGKTGGKKNGRIVFEDHALILSWPQD